MKEYIISCEELRRYTFTAEAEDVSDIRDAVAKTIFPLSGEKMITCIRDKVTGRRTGLDISYDDLKDIAKESKELERMVECFQAYIENDIEAAGPEYVYEALMSAGLSEEDIRTLGYGECIPQEEEEV